jgi:DICT domain-containing protein
MNISLFRSVANQYQQLRQVNTVSMMNMISQQIEDQILHHRLTVDLYAGFQRFSHFPDQLRRYSRLGAICRRVYVFGIADYQPLSIPGIEFIEISPTSALAQEWFLLVNTPDFWATLVAQEIEGKDPAIGGRRFDGILSYDEAVVDRIALLMSQVMEMPYEPVSVRQYAKQNLHISEISSRMVALHEKAELLCQRRWVRLATLQQITELSSTNLLEVLHHAAQILQDVFGATGVAIALKIANQQYTITVAEGDANGKGWKMPLGEGVCGQVIQQGRLVQQMDVRKHQRSDFVLPLAQSMIVAPIASRQLYGAIALGNSKANCWNDEDSRTVAAIGKLLANQFDQTVAHRHTTSIATPNQRLQQFISEQQKSLERLRSLQQKLRALQPTAPQMELLNQMESTHTNLAQTTQTTLSLLNGSSNTITINRRP